MTLAEFLYAASTMALAYLLGETIRWCVLHALYVGAHFEDDERIIEGWGDVDTWRGEVST